MNATQTQSQKTPEQAAAEEAAKRKAKATDNLKARYPHAKPETLRWNAQHGKLEVEIVCTKCGASRTVFTSDLFQIKLCGPCTEANRKERKQAKKELLKAAMAKVALY